jgi:glycosyltransferase involved in cell wall biosynthesis
MNEVVPAPFFSIITVVRNAKNTIEDCIQSVGNQIFTDFEYIVIDGLSDDGTSELISKHVTSIDTYVREKDAGIYDAMNKAIAMCRGRYIGIINADDLYFEDTLINVQKVITEFPNSQIIYGGVEILAECGGTLFVDHSNLDRAMIAHPACFVSAEAYRIFGSFNLDYKVAADYDFMLRARNAGAVFQNSGLLLAKYRPGGASAKFRLQSIKEMNKIQGQHIGWSPLYRCYRLIRYLGATFLKPAKLKV